MPTKSDRPGSSSFWLKSLISGLLFIVLLLVAEEGTRLWVRLRQGNWPSTQTSQNYEQALLVRQLYRLRPYLGAGPVERGSAEVAGKKASFNSLGYRGAERLVAKQPGALRILCAGGSTTFDLLSPSNELSWPSKLENRLRGEGLVAEVWNAGFPGWTSLENLISLELRDVDLAPDLVILYQGINDLQPAAARPLDATYESSHFPLLRSGLGLDAKRPGLLERSVLVERLLRARQRSQAAQSYPSRVLPPEALATLRRNVRSFIAVTRASGARVLLATQPLRIRVEHDADDRQYLENWVPGLAADQTLLWLQAFNIELRTIATAESVDLADAAVGIDWQDSDFADPMHYSRAGAEKLAQFFAQSARTVLAEVAEE